MKSRKQKSLYLGGGFRDHQILYMIPIIIGTCKRYKIKKIILEKKLSPKVQKLDFIKKNLKGYDQKRLYAYLAERYLSFWFKKHTKYIEWDWAFFEKK